MHTDSDCQVRLESGTMLWLTGSITGEDGMLRREKLRTVQIMQIATIGRQAEVGRKSCGYAG